MLIGDLRANYNYPRTLIFDSRSGIILGEYYGYDCCDYDMYMFSNFSYTPEINTLCIYI